MYRLLLTLGLLLWSMTPFATETITLRADDWCPYNCQPTSDKPGFVIEIAQQIFKKAGYAVDYQVMPWARAILETREGRYHAVAGAFKEDAPDFIFPQNEMGTVANTFFVKSGTTWKFKEMSSLETATIGIIRDYSYGKQLDEYIEKHKKDPKRVQIVSGENPAELNIKKLMSGRISTLLDAPMTIQYYMSTHPQQEKLVEAGTVNSEKLYIAFSPRLPTSQQYAKILSEGIQELRTNGTLQAILAKYGLKDWQ